MDLFGVDWDLSEANDLAFPQIRNGSCDSVVTLHDEEFAERN